MNARCKRVGKTITIALLLVATRVAAEPTDAPSPSHLATPRVACREQDPGDCVRLRPGFWVDEAWWSAHDTEDKRLQDAETRLTVENTSLRAAASGWQPGWKTIGAVFVSAVSLGIYVGRKL